MESSEIVYNNKSTENIDKGHLLLNLTESTNHNQNIDETEMFNNSAYSEIGEKETEVEKESILRRFAEKFKRRFCRLFENIKISTFTAWKTLKNVFKKKDKKIIVQEEIIKSQSENL